MPLGVACAALVIAGCGGSGSGRRAPAQTRAERTDTFTTTIDVRLRPTATDAAPSSAVGARAAKLTASEPGYRAHISASIVLPQFNGNAITATGSGYFDSGSGSGTLDVDAGLPGLLGLAGSLPTRVVLAGGEAYAQVPSDLASLLSISDRWLEISPARLDLDSLNPATILSQVARDATTRVPGQQAQVTIDPATGLVRTIALNYTEPGGYRVRVRLRFTGFGPEPASPAPPVTQVGNLAAALEQLGV